MEAEDLSFVTETLSSAQEVDDDELDVELGCTALAACEVIARLQGRAGRKDPVGDLVDQWVRSHPVKPPPAVIKLATNVLDRVAEGSELALLWRGDTTWLSQVKELRRRVAGSDHARVQ